ncbi:PTS N-acetylgalactosamine transporter subunit IID, partial [Vibrio anguillarum]|nr:PTS N-acetylgalactosamine transporter subunit IID [Vibrio anguillarum]
LAMYALVKRGWSPLKLIGLTVALGVVGRFMGFL